MRPRLLLIAAAAALAACSTTRRPADDQQPTLASLSQRAEKVAPDGGIQPTEEATIAAYKDFLQAAPQAPQRAEALRRLGDLEMDRADRVAAEGAGSAPDYGAAIARYQAFLQAYPQDPANDRVLYQLARAQEQTGALEAALKTLDRLVQQYPGTLHADEANFRRGELLFTLRDYARAEAAYAGVLQAQRSPFHDRALYMQGWAMFKQGRLEDALQPFFGVLDVALGGLGAASREEADLSALRELKRADRELVEDTFRVMGIALSNLKGADSIARYIDSPVREGYQFRVYQQLAELYLRQERVKDAADAYAAFVRREPLHAQAPLMQARVIAIYEAGGLPTLALQAKQDYVQRYGAESEFRRANPLGWARAQPLVKTHLAELARHHHALAQQSHAAADVQQAVRWYRLLLTSFPDDAGAAASRFLLAELLFEDRQWAEAAREYETVAYRNASDSHAADAGYAALLAYAALEKDTADEAARRTLQHQDIASALQFNQTFAADSRNGAVLTRAAEQLYALGEGERASAIARQALALQPPPALAQRRTAWTVIAHQAFERGAYAEAEQGYGELLALTDAQAPGRGEIAERQAAAIYKQGEAARSGGDVRAAVGHFARVAALSGLAGTSAVRASAQYDAAAALIGLKDWAGAAQALEDFRRDQPGHALQTEVPAKLALAYLELGRPAQAAAEFERVAAQAGDPVLARGALWQAAELQQQAAVQAPPKSPLLATAIKAWERYLQQFPAPLEPAVQARWQLATLTRQDGQTAKALAWTQAVQQADASAGDARTPRTRALGGQAALQLTEPLLAAYRKVPLIEPLAKQLKLKKAKMEEVLRAYAAAAEQAGGEAAEVTTAATFHTAALYQDFGKALIDSARPKKLSKTEREQYDVMLEEQAFPFEEKAIELHESNARRTAAGVYDEWVKKSLEALAKLKPVRYGKVERGDDSLPADLAALNAALQAAPADARLLNQRGIALRRLGRFDDARQAYEAAIAIAPQAVAPQLNLAILRDLYLGDAAGAVPLYQHCLELAPAEAPLLGKWLAELKSRKPLPNTAETAQTAKAKEPT